MISCKTITRPKKIQTKFISLKKKKKEREPYTNSGVEKQQKERRGLSPYDPSGFQISLQYSIFFILSPHSSENILYYSN